MHVHFFRPEEGGDSPIDELYRLTYPVNPTLLTGPQTIHVAAKTRSLEATLVPKELRKS
jgi:hypothetical protein